ncbi:MAG: alkylated DNA nucleotide flippase Atl1 [Cognaticolwellia sp.]
MIKRNISSNVGKPFSSKYIRIWQTVLAIPVGKVAYYSQIADLAALPTNAWHGQTVPW